MKRLPIVLALEGKKAVIVGGGRVAARHVEKLIHARMKEIIVYSPTVHDEFLVHINNETVTWVKEVIVEPRSFDADVLLLTTPNESLHRELYQYKKPYQLVYVATDHELSDIHFPLTIRRGDLTIALTTNGSSPLYTKRMKQKIEQNLDEHIEDDLAFLYEVRMRLRQMDISKEKRRRLLKMVVSDSVLRRSDRQLYVEELIRNKIFDEYDD
ncbi:precorrin-2 dehydrogenase/sirohydrochlorin ferrochelatase family protein [Halalkalibacter hemicellulosilyticus]|uniref:precorrin-2 dehydrogenase n=1 Tax=Halalkalibacter hemicellulosilyticusJCM 9152 TaxID=1236971 RepID=W4QFC4_9BACI|nr:bifunctional precorrin-2 dehydrogenase/sirohydrochlorin ferrochelatase [Halalkalibacter hemicellulosilyticus]GAE30800.1 siroheme synthase [Halalkalibacter hemicellulosilyticusJCM 9152]